MSSRIGWPSPGPPVKKKSLWWFVISTRSGKVRIVDPDSFQLAGRTGNKMVAYPVTEMCSSTYETVNAMGGVIEHVAQYNSEAGALGYTFRYFLESLNQEKNVKMLSVDGVYPTVETIENGTYPLTVPLVAVTRKDNDNPNVRKVLDFLLSEDGQDIIRRTGYGGK